jgi:hypothetical protein
MSGCAFHSLAMGTADTFRRSLGRANFHISIKVEGRCINCSGPAIPEKTH